MATKTNRPPRKGWKAANQNKGGTKSVGTKMLNAVTITSKFGAGIYNNGDFSRPGEIKKARTRGRKK